MAKAKKKPAKKVAPKKDRRVKVEISNESFKILDDLGYIDLKSGELNAVGNAALLKELNRMMDEG